MVKKRQKDLDFQKVKLKVGRKLVKGTNVTKTDFKSKKIMLREVKDLGENPLLSLSRNPSSNNKFKLLCLGRLRDQIVGDSTQVNGEAINILAKMMLEEDERVRSQAIKNIKNYLNSMVSKNLDISPFLTILLGYSKCAITHLSPGVNNDAKDFLEYIIPKCDENLYKQLMITILARLSVASHPTAKDLELASSIAEKVLPGQSFDRHKSNVETHDWTKSQGFIDLSAINPRKPVTNYNISFQLINDLDVAGKFCATLRLLVESELNYLKKRKSADLSIDQLEARKLTSYLKMAKIFQLNCDDFIGKLKKLSVVRNDSQKMSAKDSLDFNTVVKKLDTVIKSLETSAS